MRKIFIFLSAFILIISCDDKPLISGRFEFNTSELDFDFLSSSQVLSTEETGWMLDYIQTEGEILNVMSNLSIIEEDDSLSRNYFLGKGAKFEPISFWRQDISDSFTLQWKWFEIKRTDNNHLTITVMQNNTGKERNAKLGINNRDYCAHIQINQEYQ